MWIHLGFTYAKYAICGATQNELNRVTAVATEATCPDCLKEHNDNERVNESMHRHGMTPEYEVTS